MKILKDPDQVLQILMEKKFQLCKKFREAEWDAASRISGQEISIGCVRGHIRYAMSDHRGFNEADMAAIYEYVANTKKAAREYINPRDTWYMKGLAEGAAWALKEIEKRMEKEP